LSSQYRYSTKEDMIESLSSNPSFKTTVETLLADDSPSVSFDEKQSLVNEIKDLDKISKGLEDINKSLKYIIADPNKSRKKRNDDITNRLYGDTNMVKNDSKS